MIRLCPIAFGYDLQWRGQIIGRIKREGEGWRALCTLVIPGVFAEPHAQLAAAARSLIRFVKNDTDLAKLFEADRTIE